VIDRQALQRLPARPVSEVEWEEVLLRLELMPRALKLVLEEVRTDAESVRGELRRMVEREESAREFLESAAGLLPTSRPTIAQPSRNQEDAVDRIVRLRNRNFALVQRRGIEVWDWAAPDRGDEPGGTMYQLLAYLTASDGATLAALRRLVRG
jgi:hypothetical protein